MLNSYPPLLLCVPNSNKDMHTRGLKEYTLKAFAHAGAVEH